MLCSQCKKNEAEVFLKKIVHNQVTQIALCRACAEDRGLLPGSQNLFADLLAGLGVLLKQESSPKHAADLRCASCGIRYSQFMQTGRLGCPDCYAAFREPLSDLLKSIHGSNRHVGQPAKTEGPARKTPAAPPPDSGRLRQELQAAVAREDFEEAAILRDQLHRLEKP